MYTNLPALLSLRRSLACLSSSSAIDREPVRKLKQRAAAHSLRAEAEHRAIDPAGGVISDSL